MTSEPPPRSGPEPSALRLLWTEIRSVRGQAAAAVAVLLASVGATLACPLLVRVFIDRANGGTLLDTLAGVALGYLGLALLAAAMRVAASNLGVRCGWRIADSLRMKLLRHATVGRSILDIESVPVGEVLEKVEGNADVVGRAIAESGFAMIGNVAIVAGTLCLLFFVVPAAGIGITALALIVCVVLRRLSRIAVGRWERARNQRADLFGFIGDAQSARDDLLVAAESAWATNRIAAELDKLYRTEGGAYIYGRAFWPLTQLFVALAFGFGFGFALHRLELGAISIGALTVIYLYVDALQRPLELLSSQADQLQQMLAALAIAARTLGARTAEGVQPAAGARRLPDGPLDVRFEHVDFGYGDEPVLRAVSFEVAAGRSLGIIGRTGAGKSTVINLLCGLGRPQSGRVLIGDVDACEPSAAEFARRVTVLSQRAHLFGASVRDNVTLFDDSATDERILDVPSGPGYAPGPRSSRRLPAGIRARCVHVSYRACGAGCT